MGALSAALVPPLKPGKLADLDAFYTEVPLRPVRLGARGAPRARSDRRVRRAVETAAFVVTPPHPARPVAAIGSGLLRTLPRTH